MLRRTIIAGLAAALAAPTFTVTPASAAILFTCPAIDSAGGSVMQFQPGWSHTPRPQNNVYNYIPISTPCSNGDVGIVDSGSALGYNATTSFPPRPLGCPVAWGGAGPDYADQTPILFGPDGGPDAFRFDWYAHGDSRGSFKAKAGPVGDQYRLIFNITTGAYAPPAGKKTKVKLTVRIAPWRGSATYTCADDSDPDKYLKYVELTSVGQVIVSQK